LTSEIECYGRGLHHHYLLEPVAAWVLAVQRLRSSSWTATTRWRVWFWSRRRARHFTSSNA